jgi:hypothetical protein
MNEKEPPAAFIAALTTEHFRAPERAQQQHQRGRYPSIALSLLTVQLAGGARRLSPDAAERFSPESGRWPENRAWPALKSGPFVGYITTTASLVAFLNSIVAAVGVAMLVGGLLRERQPVVASLIGAGVALLLMVLFFVYQKWRHGSAPQPRVD